MGRSKENSNYGLKIAEVEQIPELVEQGLYAVCICLLGEDRSCYVASMLNNSGHHAIYIADGFEGIRKLSEKGKKAFFELVAKAPHLFVFLDEFEQRVYEVEIQSIKHIEGLVIYKDTKMIKEYY